MMRGSLWSIKKRAAIGVWFQEEGEGAVEYISRWQRNKQREKTDWLDRLRLRGINGAQFSRKFIEIFHSHSTEAGLLTKSHLFPSPYLKLAFFSFFRDNQSTSFSKMKLSLILVLLVGVVAMQFVQALPMDGGSKSSTDQWVKMLYTKCLWALMTLITSYFFRNSLTLPEVSYKPAQESVDWYLHHSSISLISLNNVFMNWEWKYWVWKVLREKITKRQKMRRRSMR